jgi:hypothetical protein
MVVVMVHAPECVVGWLFVAWFVAVGEQPDGLLPLGTAGGDFRRSRCTLTSSISEASGAAMSPGAALLRVIDVVRASGFA